MPKVTPLADLPHAQMMFLDLLSRLQVGPNHRTEVAALLRAPWRRYHGTGHAGLLWDRHLTHGGNSQDAIAAHAIAYHDAVYEVGATDNEARSAMLWRSHAHDLPTELREAVERAILATADHTAIHADPDACWLVDLDLTPLGEPWTLFSANTTALRQEIGLPDSVAIPGQAVFLRRLLALPRIYRSSRNGDAIATAYEATARINLTRVLG